MKKEINPIDDEHVAAVGDQLDRKLASGPAPPKSWTRQALIDFHASKLNAMRAANFSLDEIADALSHKTVTFTRATVSTYLSRTHALSTCGSATAKKTKSKTSNRASKSKARQRAQVALEASADVPLNALHFDQAVAPTSPPVHQIERFATAQKTTESQKILRATIPRTDSNAKTKSRTGGDWMNDFS